MRDPALMGTTPTLTETIRTLIDAQLVDLNSCMPGVVVAYNSATQTADIQPAIKREYWDGIIQDRPIIPGVPVAFPRGGTAHMHWPLQAGDSVILIFSQRSLDNWKTTGGKVDPQDVRKFHLSDALAIPGVAAPPQAFVPENPNALEIVNDDMRVVFHDTGKVELKNSTGELISLLSDITDKLKTLCSTLGTDTVNTMFGPMPLNSFATYTQLSNDLGTLLSDLDSFKQ
jgi:hypothetical protein